MASSITPTPTDDAKPQSPQKFLSVGRVAEYLCERQVELTGHQKADDGLIASIKSAMLGRFLTLADSTIRPGTQVLAKDNLVSECTNVGLISALMLTIVVPMTYDNVTDWLEEDFLGSGYLFLDGYIGQLLGADAVQQASSALNDAAMIFYIIGFSGFLCSTIATVIILLCIGEVQTELGCQEFMRRVGSFTRMPYLFFMVGFLFAFASAVRYFVTMKTLGGLIALALGMLLIALLIAFTCDFFVRCCIRAHNSINEFEELHLSDAQVQEDVDAWFAHNPKRRTLDACVADLSGLAPTTSLLIKLDGISQQRVAVSFHRKQADSLGLHLSPTDLYRLSCERTA